MPISSSGVPSGTLGPTEDAASRTPLETGRPEKTVTEKRKYIGMMFECCQVYQRIYINRAGTAYTGCCPRCLQRVTLRVGEDGIEARMFRAK